MMTHDQLIEQIKDNPTTLAVVRLHKPDSDKFPFCVECRRVWQGEIDVVLYPCPTVRAIEKELA